MVTIRDMRKLIDAFALTLFNKCLGAEKTPFKELCVYARCPFKLR